MNEQERLSIDAALEDREQMIFHRDIIIQEKDIVHRLTRRRDVTTKSEEADHGVGLASERKRGGGHEKGIANEHRQ